MKTYTFDGRTWTDAEISKFLEPDIKLKPITDTRLKKTMELIEGPNVLEVGCAIGILDYRIAAAHPNWNVTGLDVLANSIEIANDKFKLPNLTYKCEDLFKTTIKPNSLDCVLFLEVIEHISNQGAFLAKFKELLKPGGCLVISTPNAVSLLNQLRHYSQNVTKRVKDIKNEQRNTGTHLEHIVNYDAFTLARLLDRAGFEYEAHYFQRFTIPFSRSKYVELPQWLSPKTLRDDIIIKVRKPA